MYKLKLFIDFDGIYQHASPAEDTFVLTNLYKNSTTFNVNSNNTSWNEIYAEHEKFINDLNLDMLKSKYGDIDELNVYSFTSFLYPLGQWYSKILQLLNDGTIDVNTQVIFSSYSKNDKVFVFEAEGETNGQFLYQKSFYLSKYIEKYLKYHGFKNIHLNIDKTVRSNIYYYLRGGIVFLVKFLQILFYKFFIRNRNKLSFNDTGEKKILISSRGIVQTQFIKNLYEKFSDRFVLMVNESSSKPFRNLKVSRSFESYYFAEGNISFSQLFRESYFVIKNYFGKKYPIVSTFYGIELDFSKILPECSIKRFHCKTYSLMIENSIINIEKENNLKIAKILSMEMLPPFPYYLHQDTNLPVYQVQTSALFCAPYPRFVYNSKFFFTDLRTYSEFMKLNISFKDKFGLLKNVKYLGLEKKSILTQYKSITYFSQPIYLDEENQLIEFLKEFCQINNLKFRVKFHPRAVIPNIDLSDIEIIEGTKNATDVISESDIVATRTSAIGVDCWFLNVPVLFFVHGTMKKDDLSFIPKDYKGAIDGRLDFDSLKNDLPAILENFYSHPIHREFSIDEELIEKELMN